MRKILFGFAALAAIVALFAVIAAWQVVRFLDAPVTLPDEGLTYDIRPGMPFAAVSDDLGALGVISHPRIFRWYARLTGDANSIRAGEYVIESGATPPDVLRKFVSGEVLMYSFTIVEGWTHRELLNALRRHSEVEATLDDDGWDELLQSLGSAAPHPEGLFLPETYRFPRATTDAEILRHAYRMMEEALHAEWDRRAPDLPLSSPYEALVLASIVERETAREDERARIAGVFVRRLRLGMRLQTDPTVIYGIGDAFDGNLTRSHLRTPTPYNTYTISGLPPTPIALPGRASIRAALNPAPGPELFFVATGLGDGSHKFSTTREEHEAAVAEYLVRLRQSRRATAGGNGQGQ